MLNFKDFVLNYQRVPVEEYPNRVLEAVPEPVVSVQVSTYQHANFICDCLDGILMQEMDFPVEILIGEDESSDGTREICQAYADRHPDKIRLFLHRRENNIAIHGRPTGRFQSTYTRFKCRGKYIALCEGDDYWTDPLKLQKQVDFLEGHPEYVLSHHDASIINEQGDTLDESKLPDDNKRDFTRLDLMMGPFLLTLSLCARNVLETVPPEFLEVLNGDKFYISLLGQHGKGRFQGEVEPAVYRVHSESIWSSQSDLVKAKALAHTFHTLLEYYSNSTSTELKNYLANRYASELKWLYHKNIFREHYLPALKIYSVLARHQVVTRDFMDFSSFGITALRVFLGRLRQRVTGVS